ncbi:hypothetical protein DY000_02040273 [Brassica cretica]|uniref:Uncharacterized protein n=1 Tax=Brassica cretica TaxID=69181 RepID=A0ABQ7B7W0_BRACR|nr:hypothetical protein DY000_02040273 [Brassica cretica]
MAKGVYYAEAVGVKIGHDGINVRKSILLYEKLCGRNTSHRTRARRGLLCSNRTHVPLGRYVATSSSQKVRSLRSDRARAKARSLRCDRARAGARSLRSDRARAEARSLRSDRARAKAQSLRSDRARTKVRSLRSDRALPKRRYDISPCILVYPPMLPPEYHSEPISRSPPFLSYQPNFTVKTAESSFFIERSRNKRFESEDGPKGPKT